MYIIRNPTVEYLSETVFKNFVSFEEDKVVLMDDCPKDLAIMFYHIEPPHIRNPICKCGNKLHKHAIVNWNMDLKYPIFKYQYKCEKCGKTIITPLKGIVDKYCSYTKDTKNLVVNIYSNEHISYANASNFINDNCTLNISRQTTYNYNSNETDTHLLEKEINTSSNQRENNPA